MNSFQFVTKADDDYCSKVVDVGMITCEVRVKEKYSPNIQVALELYLQQPVSSILMRKNNKFIA